MFFFGEGTSRKTHNNQDPRPKNGREFPFVPNISGHLQVPNVRKFGGKKVLLGPPALRRLCLPGRALWKYRCRIGRLQGLKDVVSSLLLVVSISARSLRDLRIPFVN